MATCVPESRKRSNTDGAVTSRSPSAAAVLSVVTLTVYGFWWWWRLNRDLQAEGENTHPWPALAAVTIGWVFIVPPFRSVRDTTEAIAAAQQRAGLQPSARSQPALRLAVTAAVGLVLFATSSVLPAGFWLFGWIPIAFGMALVYYEQREFNRTITGWPTAGIGSAVQAESYDTP